MILKALGLSIRSKHRVRERLDQGFSMRGVGGEQLCCTPRGRWQCLETLLS